MREDVDFAVDMFRAMKERKTKTEAESEASLAMRNFAAMVEAAKLALKA